MLDIVISRGRVVTAAGEEITDIGIKDGKIAALGSGLTGQTVLQAAGLWAAPGLVDIHIHGCAGFTALQGEAGIANMSRALAAHGVAAFCPTVEPAPLDEMRAAIAAAHKGAQQGLPGARTLGVHLEGPFLGTAYKGAINPQYYMPATQQSYTALCAPYQSAVRRITVDPTRPGVLELIPWLTAQGVAVSLGHTDAEAALCDAAFDAGAVMATHLFNAMAPLHHREGHLPAAALTHPAAGVEVIADLVHLEPHALKLAYAAKGWRKTALISDAMAAAGMPDGDYTLGGLDVLVRGGVARIPAGNLAGSTLFMDEAVRNMVSLGIPAADALRMGGITPAALVGVQHDIRPGCPADIVLMDDKLQVQRTLVGGCTVYERS